SRSTPSWSAAPQRARSAAEALGLAEERAQHRVELLRALEHRHVPRVRVDLHARVRDRLGETGGVADRYQPVLGAPDDERRAADQLQARAQIVVEDRLERGHEAIGAGAPQ